MCHYRGSYASESQVKAETERQRERDARRTEAVDKLLQEADRAAQKPAPAQAKDVFPAK